MNSLVIYPKKIDYSISCVGCGSDQIEPLDFFFPGTHSIADCRCKKCGTEFYDLLPIAHGRHFSVSISKNGTFVRYPERARLWLAEPLITALFNCKTERYPIRKEVIFETKNAILLNCLDSCYGHVFLKLLNAQFHLENKEGLVLLLPASFRWLVPEGVAEVWSVDAPPAVFDKYLNGLDEFIKSESERFEYLALSPTHIHPDSTRIHFELFLREKKFDLREFIKKSPTVCFIVREDRLWLGSPIWSFFSRVVNKTSVRFLQAVFLNRQKRLFKRTVTRIKRKLPACRFITVGVGQRTNYATFTEDFRNSRPTESTERAWCALYAQTHIVVGVHGSGMLIPTALSAGFLEILPRHKIDHLTEDVVLTYKNQYSHFLGRYTDEYAKPSLVAQHILSMLKNYDFYQATTEIPVRARHLKTFENV